MRNYSFDPYSAWKMGIDPVATGKAWRQKRRDEQLTQEALSDIFDAADMPMSKSAISAVENGKHTPSIHHAFFFAELCGCLVEDLVVTYRRSFEAADRDQVAPFTLQYVYKATTCKSQVVAFFMVNLR